MPTPTDAQAGGPDDDREIKRLIAQHRRDSQPPGSRTPAEAETPADLTDWRIANLRRDHFHNGRVK